MKNIIQLTLLLIFIISILINKIYVGIIILTIGFIITLNYEYIKMVFIENNDNKKYFSFNPYRFITTLFLFIQVFIYHTSGGYYSTIAEGIISSIGYVFWFIAFFSTFSINKDNTRAETIFIISLLLQLISLMFVIVNEYA